MNDFIVRQREDEIFGERIKQAERELVLVEPPMDRIVTKILQHVVHPAHVPLERKAKPTGVGGP